MKKVALIAAALFAAPAYAQDAYGPPPEEMAFAAPDDSFRLQPDQVATVEAPAPVEAPTDDRNFIEKIGPRKLAAFTIANAYDKASTARCVRARTCEEAGLGVNALFGKRPSNTELVGAFLIDEALYIGGSAAFGETLGYDSGAMRGFQIGMIGTRGVIGTLNLRFGGGK